MQIEYLARLAQKFLRLAMAIQAPPHVKWLRLPGDRHLIDPAVASHAGYAFIYMDAVIKIDVVG
jgi:hypothetical protein